MATDYTVKIARGLNQHSWSRVFVEVMIFFSVGTVQAGISGQLETMVEQDNQHERRIEERLGLAYNNKLYGLHSGLSLAFSQGQGENNKTLTQLYIEKSLRKKRSLLTIGRLQRSDSFGFYTLDGLLFKHHFNSITLTLHGGLPSRMEGLSSIEGEALYGFNLQASKIQFTHYMMSGRLGGQHLKQNNTENRLNIGGRGIHQQKPSALFPSAFSFSGSYLIDSNRWESLQLNTYRDFENNARLRLGYETYQPNRNELTFKDRFYSLYARGRQSQLKVEYQTNQKQQHTASINGRQVTREFGSNGYGINAIIRYRSNQGWQLLTQIDHLTLANENFSSLYFESNKSISSMMRGTFSGVFQYQEKQLTGNNHSAGIEAKLTRRIKSKILALAFLFSAETTYIHNSRLTNEYRIAIRLLHHFDDRKRKSLL